MIVESGAGSQPAAASQAASKATARRGLLAFFALIGVLVAAAVVGGILPRLTRQKALLAATENQTEQRPIVEVATARPAPARSTLDLPGDMQALVDSPASAWAGVKSRYAIPFWKMACAVSRCTAGRSDWRYCSSHPRSSQRSPSKMESSEDCVLRSTSVSSMRRIIAPP